MTIAAVGSSASLSISVIARAIQPGELVVLVVTDVDPIASVRASGFDRDLPAYAAAGGKWHVLAGIDLETRPG